jgi:hypothetical protein
MTQESAAAATLLGEKAACVRACTVHARMVLLNEKNVSCAENSAHTQTGCAEVKRTTTCCIAALLLQKLDDQANYYYEMLLLKSTAATVTATSTTAVKYIQTLTVLKNTITIVYILLQLPVKRTHTIDTVVAAIAASASDCKLCADSSNDEHCNE